VKSSPANDRTPVPPAYARTAPAPLDASPLAARVRADVAVVGAGFTGLATALHLAQKGVSVAVLERSEVGWGGSGRAFGQVVPYSKHYEDHVLSTYGAHSGERLINFLAGGPDLVFGLVQRHGIECEAIRTGLLFAAHSRAAARRLEQRAKFWQARSAPVSIVESDALEKLVGSRYYPAALLDNRGGCVNPLAYARGLARAAIGSGARIFERSPVTALRRHTNGWVAQAAAGEVEVDSVVLATDGYTDGLWPGLRASMVAIRAYHIFSSPLNDDLRRTILPEGRSLTDTRRLYSGIRVHPDGRLHMSVDGPAFSNNGMGSTRLGSARARALFPQLGDISWEEQVAGWVGASNDLYPHIHELDKGVFGAVGLSGRGIALGTLLGIELTKRVLRLPENECALPLSPLRPVPGMAFTQVLVASLLNLYRILDYVDLHSGYVKPAT
jgi:glycine/D-amino acid oxidase-like deaminating enzyme